MQWTDRSKNERYIENNEYGDRQIDRQTDGWRKNRIICEKGRENDMKFGLNGY